MNKKNGFVNFIQSILGKYDFVQVDEKLYRGGQPDEAHYKMLVSLGVKSVICLRILTESIGKRNYELAQKYGLKYYHIPLNPLSKPEIRDIKIFASIIKDNTNLPVYLFCRTGRDRTGIMCAIYRIFNGWCAQDAYKEMKSNGYHALLFPHMRDFLFQFAANLHETLD